MTNIFAIFIERCANKLSVASLLKTKEIKTIFHFDREICIIEIINKYQKDA